MPYSYPDHVPAVAQHWTESEKKRCASAAQAVLNRNGSEEEAIFACIHVAGRSRHKAHQTYGPTDEQNEDYFDLQDKVRDELEGYGRDYANGTLSKDEYEKKLKDKITDYIIDLAILGAGDDYELTDEDVDDITKYTQDAFDLLDQMLDFVSIREDFSDDYLAWRASIYGYARDAFLRFTMPRDIWFVLPDHPEESCLGGPRCGCQWDIEMLDDGSASCTWTLGDTEHCSVCIANSISYNPYVISASDI